MSYVFDCFILSYIFFYLICWRIWYYYTCVQEKFFVKSQLTSYAKFDDVVRDNCGSKYIVFSKTYICIHNVLPDYSCCCSFSCYFFISSSSYYFLAILSLSSSSNSSFSSLSISLISFRFDILINVQEKKL